MTNLQGLGLKHILWKFWPCGRVCTTFVVLPCPFLRIWNSLIEQILVEFTAHVNWFQIPTVQWTLWSNCPASFFPTFFDCEWKTRCFLVFDSGEEIYPFQIWSSKALMSRLAVKTRAFNKFPLEDLPKRQVDWKEVFLEMGWVVLVIDPHSWLSFSSKRAISN